MLLISAISDDATKEINLDVDWWSIMKICDLIRQGDTRYFLIVDEVGL